MATLKFLRQSRTTPLSGNLRSTWVLTTDDWDDFGSKVQFRLSYFDARGVQRNVGSVKILRRKNLAPAEPDVSSRTVIPPIFSFLDEDYISLGQSDSYYKALRGILGDHVDEFLEAVRDISWQPTLATEFEPTSIFRNAMMRNNDAHRARRFGRAWASGDSVREQVSFIYTCEIEGADLPVSVDISLDEDDPLPHRVVGIIGRNAVGKTRFLAQLAEDLVQISRTSAEAFQQKELRFPDGRPLFTRVMAISYSAFDRFKRPPQSTSSNYVYCGIRNDKGILSRNSLLDAYRKNQDRIRKHGREHQWLQHMQTILGDQSESLAHTLQEEIESSTTREPLSSLSSGQSILCHFTTALLAWIEQGSLVLFDEPETHLHPNAVASLFLVLKSVLNTYESFAILATHSPLVIQEIPSKRVIVFERTGNLTTAAPLGMESFGESISELTRHVFETVEVENPYKKKLKALARDYSPREVLDMFDQGLSLNAQAFLIAQYKSNN